MKNKFLPFADLEELKRTHAIFRGFVTFSLVKVFYKNLLEKELLTSRIKMFVQYS